MLNGLGDIPPYPYLAFIYLQVGPKNPHVARGFELLEIPFNFRFVDERAFGFPWAEILGAVSVSRFDHVETKAQ